MIRVSRRAATCSILVESGGSPLQVALLDDSLASFERPRGAAFQLSLTLLAALSDSGPYPALGGWHPPFALHAQAALLRQRAARGRRALTASRRPFQGRSPPRLARPQPRARLRPFRSPLLRAPPLLSPPGLTDMLKFGPSSQQAGGKFIASRGQTWSVRAVLRRSACCRVSPPHSKGDDSHRAEARRHQSRSVLRSSSTPEPSGPLSPVELNFLNIGGCHSVISANCGNDPAAGSPTAALLRLLLPPDGQARGTSPHICTRESGQLASPSKSVGATGGVYKRQGRSRRAVITDAY